MNNRHPHCNVQDPYTATKCVNYNMHGSQRMEGCSACGKKFCENHYRKQGGILSGTACDELTHICLSCYATETERDKKYFGHVKRSLLDRLPVDQPTLLWIAAVVLVGLFFTLLK